jgi:beta-glucanase (GH16 family)
LTKDDLRSQLINIYDGRFHTFGVLRSAEGYTFYLDGNETDFVPAANFSATPEAGFLSFFWSAPKASGAGRNESQYDTNAEMVIDYVRVYSSLPETLGKAEASQARMVFDDDFIGSELDDTKWERCPEQWRAGMSYWEQDMSYVDGNGNLILRMEWGGDEVEDIQWVDCGAVRTLGRFHYGYGYYESSMRFTEHYGVWGAFWMMCGDLWAESAAGGVEIDILETIDNQNGTYNHALHSNYNSLNSLGPELLFHADLYDGEYHTVGLLRAENGYFFYIDNKLSALVPHYRYTPCPMDGYIKLTCESAVWSGGGTPECIEDLPAEMVVDYVRVWDSMPDLNS